MLNELAYSPRLFYLEWVEPDFKDNPDTVEGRITHKRVAQEAVDHDPRLLGAVSVLLGHQNIATTVRHYAKPRMDRVLDELAKVWQEGGGG